MAPPEGIAETTDTAACALPATMTGGCSSPMSLDHLTTRAPDSLRHARESLTLAVTELVDSVNFLEDSYYGGREPRSTLRDTISTVRTLMNETQLSFAREPFHVELLAKRALLLDEDRAEAMTPLVRQLKADFAQATTFLGGAEGGLFGTAENGENVYERCLAIVTNLKRYCHAVYDPTGVAHVDAAEDFATKCTLRARGAEEAVARARGLYDRFKRGALFLEEMGRASREIAMKTECEDFMYVLMVGEACDSLRSAMALALDWIQGHAEYVMFLRVEASEKGSARRVTVDDARWKQDLYNRAVYRADLAQSEMKRARRNQAELETKEADLLFQEELLSSRMGELKFDYEIKSFRMTEMKRLAEETAAKASIAAATGSDGTPRLGATVTVAASLPEQYEELSADVREFEKVLPGMNKEIQNVRQKLERVQERQREYHTLEESFAHLKEKRNIALREFTEAEKESRRLGNALELIKQIIHYVETPQTAQKIFMRLPMKHASPGLLKMSNVALNQDDSPDLKLGKAINFVARNIGSQWMSLYRQLPFFPRRGLATVEADIVELQRHYARSSLGPLVRAALERWARYHTQATLADLKEALKSIHATEILRRFERAVDPPPPPPPEIIHYPSYMDNRLIPFYEEVVRFDKMRAQHKVAAAAAASGPHGGIPASRGHHRRKAAA